MVTLAARHMNDLYWKQSRVSYFTQSSPNILSLSLPHSQSCDWMHALDHTSVSLNLLNIEFLIYLNNVKLWKLRLCSCRHFKKTLDKSYLLVFSGSMLVYIGVVPWRKGTYVMQLVAFFFTISGDTKPCSLTSIYLPPFPCQSHPSSFFQLPLSFILPLH